MADRNIQTNTLQHYLREREEERDREIDSHRKLEGWMETLYRCERVRVREREREEREREAKLRRRKLDYGCYIDW